MTSRAELAEQVIAEMRAMPDSEWHISRNVDGGAGAEDFIRRYDERKARTLAGHPRPDERSQLTEPAGPRRPLRKWSPRRASGLPQLPSCLLMAARYAAARSDRGCGYAPVMHAGWYPAARP
jgi:hypothetical protein